MFRQTLCLPLLLCAFLLPAGAEEKKEEDKQTPLKEYVVVTAAAVKESEKDVIGSFSLVPRQTIERWKLVNLNDVLDFAGPELSLAGGTYGQLSSTFIRGADSKHTLFMINNVRINDPAALSLDVAMLSPQVFRQVEVVDGPQSSLYGSEAMGGVVNLIPETGKELRASFWGGAEASVASTVAWGRELGPEAGFNLSYSFFRTDGMLANNDFTSHNLFAGFTYRHGQADWKPFLYLVHSTVGIPLNLGLPSPQRRTQTSLLAGGLPLTMKLSPRCSLDLTLGYVSRAYTLSDPSDSWEQRYHTFSRSLQAQGRLVYCGLADDAPTIIGVEADGAWVNEESDAVKSFDNLFFSSYAFWLEQIVKAGGLQGVFSLRGDKFSRFPAHISPRLSLDYGGRVAGFYGGIYALANGGFRSPKPSEYASPWGNPALLPEKSFNLEAGLQAAAAGFTCRAGVFQTDYRDMITFDYGTYRLVNSERDRIRGWQLQPQVAVGNVTLGLAYVRLQAVNQDTGARLLRRPDYILKLTLQGDWRKWYAGVFARFVGRRSDYDEQNMRVVDDDNFNVFMLTAGYRLGSRLSLFLKVQNLFDRSYMEIFGYQAPGRTVYLGIDFNM